MNVLVNKIKKRVPLKVLRKIINRRLLGCYYHTVSNNSLPHISHILKYKNTEQFEQDLRILSSEYNFISYQEYLFDSYQKNSSLILTFDDGYKELYTVVYPILKKYNIPAIFFVVTDLIDNKKIFYRNGISLLIDKVLDTPEEDWEKNKKKQIEIYINQTFRSQSDFINHLKNIRFEHSHLLEGFYKIFNLNVSKFLKIEEPYLTTHQINELNQDPLITIGAHTVDHRELYLAKNDKEIKHQIVESVNYIREITKKEFIPFAFPYTSKGVSRRVLSEIIRENTHIRGLFGEPELDATEKIVTYRFAFDSPELETIEVIRNLYTGYIKSKLSM